MTFHCKFYNSTVFVENNFTNVATHTIICWSFSFMIFQLFFFSFFFFEGVYCLSYWYLTDVFAYFSAIDSSSDENDVRTCTRRNEATECTGRNILYNELNGVMVRFCSSSNLYDLCSSITVVHVWNVLYIFFVFTKLKLLFGLSKTPD